ncbi:RxLR effector protein, partial [Phytophthora megakarya]
MRSQVFAVLFAIANVSTVFSNLVETQSTDKCNSSTDRVLRRNKSEINRDFAQNAESSEVEERGVSTPAMGMSTSPLKSTNEIDNWLSKKAPTDDVFKLLKLDQAADDLLANPKLSTWIDYMKRFNEKNPTKTSVIATLTAHYGDDGVAKIIELSKQVKATAPLARRLQNELIHRWLGAGKSPDDVFTLLTLDKAGSDLFKQPQVVTWAKYLDKFNQENQASKTTLFSFLKLRYKDETMLVQMLVAAEKVSTTKSIAERVQAEQTRQWLWMEKKPADVFKLLKLDEVGFTLLKEPLFVA